MTKLTQSFRTADEIADLIAEETVSPAFENAFTETIGGFRMGYADEPTEADMPLPRAAEIATEMAVRTRSEERRVGKEGVSTCRYRWAPYHEKKNTIHSQTL